MARIKAGDKPTAKEAQKKNVAKLPAQARQPLSISDALGVPDDHIETRIPEDGMWQPQRTFMHISEIVPYINNTKLHPEEQVNKIAASIAAYGWDQDIVVDRNKVIIKGHGRRLAVLKLGREFEQVPVTIRWDLTKEQADAARIADNRVAESEWDKPMLALELKSLASLNIDLAPLGFDAGELNDLLMFQTEILPIENTGEGGESAQGFTPTIVQPGDIWDLGSTQIMIGNDKLYALDAMIRHWQKTTGEKATLELIEFMEVGRRRGIIPTPKLEGDE